MNLSPTSKHVYSIRSFVAALLLGSVSTAYPAHVVFNDGLEHVIADAAHQNDQIQVRNGSTLVIEPGAVLGGAVDHSGRIRVYDTSTLVIRGGTLGGAGAQSGRTDGWDNAQILIEGGSFGGSGSDSGTIIVNANASVRVTGGVFGGVGVKSGQFEAYTTSKILIEDGAFGGTGGGSGRVLATHQAEVEVRGGAFGGAGPDSGTLRANGSSSWRIVGLSFNYPIGINTFPVSTLVSLTGALLNGDALNTKIARATAASVELVGIVFIRGCNTAVEDRFLEADLTLNEWLAQVLVEAAFRARNHGKFVAAMAHKLNTLVATGVLSWEEHEAIMACVATTDESTLLGGADQG